MSSSRQYSVTFDALLIGHEFGITSLSWRPSLGPDSTPTILSSSIDSSIILWSPSTVLGSTQDSTTSIWINRQRFGDVGGQRLGGFVGSLWARGGQEALGWGWAGSWRRWSCSATRESNLEDWQELGAISGHKGPVKGLAWSPNGEYLISTGYALSRFTPAQNSMCTDVQRRSDYTNIWQNTPDFSFPKFMARNCSSSSARLRSTRCCFFGCLKIRQHSRRKSNTSFRSSAELCATHQDARCR